jgi:phosphohistidine phosphatase
MKTLLILRHAKTQPDAPRGDHARELIERGERDAKRIGEYIRDEIGVPDAIVTSDATRARQTAEIVAAAIGFGRDAIVEPRIYDANLTTLLAAVRDLPDDADRVVLIGHNPGFEMLADALKEDGLDSTRLPTAGLAIVEFDAARWRDVQQHGGRLRGVVTPKALD